MRKIIVDQAEITIALLSGIKPYTIAKRFNIPISVIKDIQNDKNRPSFFRKSIKDKNKFCTCCGFRKKMPGARYLCSICFAKHNGETGIDEHSVSLQK